MAKCKYSSDARRPAINISQGLVCGIEEKLPNHGSFYSFKGIPYAEPPIGQLRFEVFVSFFFVNAYCSDKYLCRSHLDRWKNSKKMFWIAAKNVTFAFTEI